MVNPGDVLAIEMTFGGTGSYTWLDVTGNQYAAGAEWVKMPLGSNTWIEFPDRDAGFRTYVDPNPSAVPEPATLLLMGLGLAGIGYQRYRSKKAV